MATMESQLSLTDVEKSLGRISSAVSGMQKAANFEQLLQTSGAVVDCINEMYDTEAVDQLNRSLETAQRNLEAGIYPAVESFVEGLDGIEQAAMGVAGVLGMVITMFSAAAGLAVALGAAIAENWSWMEPVVMGVVGALVLYRGALIALNTAQAISNGLKATSAAYEKLHAGSSLLETAALKTSTGAQIGMNAALLACPVTWIVGGIIALVAAVTAAARAFDWFGASGTSVAGTICGLLNVAITSIGHFVLAIMGLISGVMTAVSALVGNAAAGLYNLGADLEGWFYGVLSHVLTVVAKICDAWNSLPFFDIDTSGILLKADEYAGKSVAAANRKESYIDLGEAFQSGYNVWAGDAFSGDWKQSAFQSGASFGDGLMDGLGGGFSLGTDMGVLTQGAQLALPETDSAPAADLEALAGYTGADYGNRQAVQEIHVDVGGVVNYISKDVDGEEIVRKLVERLAPEIETAMEGVYE